MMQSSEWLKGHNKEQEFPIASKPSEGSTGRKLWVDKGHKVSSELKSAPLISCNGISDSGVKS